MLIPLEDVRTFSTCPAFYHYALKNPLVLPTNRRISILEQVVQQMYYHQLKGMKPTQREIIGWVDKRVFKDIDITKEDQVEKGRALSESVLRPLRNWYEQYYLSEHAEGFINVPVESMVGGHQVTHTIGLIKDAEPIKVMLIGDAVQTRFQLYNNLLARGSAWLLAKQLDVPQVDIEHLFIGTRDHIELIRLECTEDMNNRTEQVILQIADQVAAGVNYPSYTPMCHTCPFKKECIL